jgi:hypothetical protein
VGTFEHASGRCWSASPSPPLLVATQFVAWLVKRRDWQRQNAWMAPGAPRHHYPNRAVSSSTICVSPGGREAFDRPVVTR